MLEGFRAAPQQERLWSIDPGGADTPFRTLCILELSGHLDTDFLRKALDAVAARHEILRTALQAMPGMAVPLQVVCPVVGYTFEECSESTEDLLSASCRAPLDATNGGPLRVWLVRGHGGTDRLCLVLPAFCADELGLDNLLRALGSTWTALLRGEAPPEPQVQFADLAEWQHEILDMEDSRAGLEHWRRTAALLADVAVRLPFEKPQPPGSRFVPQSRRAVVDPAVAAEIDRRARARSFEPETFYLAAWQVVLSRFSRESRVPLAVRFDGRRWEELVDVLGPLARYVPLFVEVDGGEPFESVWAAAAASFREAEAWQECFVNQHTADDAEWRMPSFGFDTGELGTFELGEARATAVVRRAWLEPFLLCLTCVRRGSAVETVLGFDAGRLTDEDTERILHCLHTLLCEAVARPEAPAGDLPLLGEGDLRTLGSALASARVERPATCLYQSFARQVLATPDAIACVSGEERITFAELYSSANRIARHLQRLGIRPEHRVGVLAERSIDMLVALLGVLGAGGAYVPLDPSYPSAHLSYILEDSAPRLVLAQDHLVGRLTGPVPALFRLSADAAALAAQPDTPPKSEATPDNLAYVIYTSGSTGRPKGVLISHRAILNRLLWMQSEFGLGANDRVLFKTQLAFDASVWEIFATILAGGTVVVARPEGHRDPAYLVREICERQVTILQLVPSMLRLWSMEPDLERCVSLRWIFSGGEALPTALVTRIRERLAAGVVNLYGPTEVSIDSAFHVCRGEEKGEIVPLGLPLPNLRLHLLDDRLNPVPPGLPGELCVSGQGVARGYLGRPDLTAERFLPDPFAKTPVREPGARLYRTGDLARLGPEGLVEFLGRVDHQVKVRGFRIEPREIEAVLAKHPAVREAVVLAREDEPGDRRLVAYAVVGRPAPDASELLHFLKQQLPEHMVPGALVLLDHLPLTPNGKLDRKALPPPGRRGAAGRALPRDPMEATLALLWSEVLGVPDVGAQDSFFELGGHSLLATQVVSRVRGAFGVDLPLRSIFESPTPAGLAGRIREARRGGTAVASPITAVPRDGRLPLSFAQQRLWFIDQLVPGTTAYNIPLVLRFRGPLDSSVLDRALGAIVRRHETLRTVFTEVDGETIQIVQEGVPRPLVQVDLTGLPEDVRQPEARRRAADLVDQPFDLARGPLFRAVLLRLAPLDHLGVLVVHHIVSDAWSSGVLLREMTALYQAFHQGLPFPLPELPIQYADFAAWQRRWLQGEVLESQLAYWRSHLADLPVLALPTDRPRPAVQSFRGRRLPFALPTEVLARHAARARPRGITSYMTLLTSLSALLHRITGQSGIVMGSPIANRNRLEIENLIGFFVNVLVLRTDVDGNPTFSALQERVRELALSAAVYQDLPFEKLVETLQPERDLSRSPLFQVVLALQNAAGTLLELPDVKVSEEPLESASAKFDLTFELIELPDDGIAGALEYNTDLFDPTTMIRLMGHFAELLRAAAETPDQPVLDLPVWPEAERHQVAAEWNDTRSLPFGEASIVSLIERQASRTPRATAVLSDEGALTYAEMNERANRIAHRLRALGVARGELVGVFLDRSLDMVPALLGVLKSGGAYVPLDPAFPAERMRWILDAFRIRVLVTQSPRLRASAEALRDLPGLSEVVCIDAAETGGLEAARGGYRVWEGLSLAEMPELDPLLSSGPDDLAYIIFTSGSTGTPKGVMVRHRPVVNLFDWVNRTFGVGPGDRVLFITSLGFDLSVYDVFGLLAAGGSVRVVTERDIREPEALVRLLSEEPITFWDSAPAALQQLVPFLPSEDQGARLRLVFLSGDWIPVALPDRIRAVFRDARVIALGGATEATVWSNSFPIGRVEPHWPSIPYGRPIPNARYHVLDPLGRPAPIGVPGDLCIGGECLAVGYAADPVQTAEKFVPDAFVSEPGGRLYRTGDRARFLADGNLEFLGRLDHQVKIRGFRIELGEIETVLAQHPGIREAVVLARADQLGDRRLVAYMAVREDAPPVSELRDHLRQRLPEYMIPAAWMFLPALPLTANGKVDRSALPSPDRSEEPDRIPPRTPSEVALAVLWSEILGLERIGVDDHFFELGGHSLLATQLSARIRTSFSVQMPLRELFMFPTLAEMAARVEELTLAASDPQSIDDLLDLLDNLDEETAARLSQLPEAVGGGAA
jgi:amino acid adenylation domain-containing protein